MKNKLLFRFYSILMAIALIAGMAAYTLTGPVCVYAENNVSADNKDTDLVYSLIDSIVSLKLRESDVDSIQNWIDGELTDNAGISSEWYIICLSQSGDYDFKNYVSALENNLKNNTGISATSRQKCALALAATSDNLELISSILDETTGQLGIMSWIFGLHIMNNGFSSSAYTVSQVIDTLLSLQLDDGGFALSGEYGDTDVTAMVIQALAPYYRTSEAVTVSVDKALTFLSSKQLDDGSFASYGTPNPESGSQVMIALSSIGIDALSDDRFIKNGNTILDSFMDFSTEDGNFSHIKGGPKNEIATIQVLCGLISYKRFVENKSGLYILDNVKTGKNNDKSAVSTDDKSLIAALATTGCIMALIFLCIKSKKHINK